LRRLHRRRRHRKAGRVLNWPPKPAFPVASPPKDPIEMYMNDVFTVPASLAGLPGASVPCGLSAEGLPLGMQLLASALNEKSIFKCAQILENATDFKPLCYKI
ncbi:MAG: amidase family protein, partial [Pseudomonadota bacterium]